ncbi:MAG: hypothetical protein IKE94_10530 [Aeriscardovia sp.]|nr:hypothetical protein [Aeriscardovia sp.]
MKKKYQRKTYSFFRHQLIRDLSTGFSFYLCDDSYDDFFAFEPADCRAEKLFRNLYYQKFSYHIEEIIDRALSSLLIDGRAYLYIKTEFTKQEKSLDGIDVPTIAIGELPGVIIKKGWKKTEYYAKRFDGSISEEKLDKKGLIVLKLEELGFNKKFFLKRIKKLEKYDIIQASDLLTENATGYDYIKHNNENNIRILKTTKGIGWVYSPIELSDSYNLYKRLQHIKFKIHFLKYVLDKINMALHGCMGDNDLGVLVAHIKEINYDNVWIDYINGRITPSQLSKLL